MFFIFTVTTAAPITTPTAAPTTTTTTTPSKFVLIITNKMKAKYHTIITFLKSNHKATETQGNATPLSHIYNRSLFLVRYRNLQNRMLG
jgi:hypothetical protein